MAMFRNRGDLYGSRSHILAMNRGEHYENRGDLYTIVAMFRIVAIIMEVVASHESWRSLRKSAMMKITCLGIEIASEPRLSALRA